MNKIIKGDRVIILAGKDKGKIGVVSYVKGSRIAVDGINLVKRHIKPNPSRGIEGGIVVKNLSLDISNVAILNPSTNKADRVGIKVLKNENGVVQRIRVFKSSGVAVNTLED
ncbi:50S ribosomal protein L24 [Neisseria sp. 23W00296]|uniref:50S ribosomal protein L24 n=1 Tax=unclassified Neisseria TaxID=2623750 RepID=UPI0002A40663|nr:MULTISPECIES: 50S ribosomal protein L24 [unclassified Neisseria]ASP17945.1 50S ribosomal protein L24 [Neisseria sp. KEM232]EKY05829.1 ribosomal protein L24 [Neisseria sp. oral taxon 020 str. F0370]